MLRCTVTSSLVFALVVASSLTAFAQAPAKPKGTAIKVDGTVSKVLPAQGILATGKDGKQYAIGFAPASKVGLVGNASIDFLTPGTYIQMTVDMDGEMKPMKEVSKIQITEQGQYTPPGIMSAKGPDGKVGEPGPFLVRGSVKTIKDDTLTVSAAGKQVVVKVAAGATIPVTIAQWQMAKEGDAISGEGIVISPAGTSPALVYADRIEIKAALPITKPGKK